MEQDKFNLQRFVDAQNSYNQYQNAVSELLAGRKSTHWIWYIFPQMKGLGHSYNSQFYGISGIEEAKAYLEHPELGNALRRVTEILIQWARNGKSMYNLLGGIYAQKAKSCLTLFDLASPKDIFGQAIDECYGGLRDQRTLTLCK